MTLAALHRWQWLLISGFVGWCLGYVTRVAPSDLPSLGNSLNSQRQFEAALVEQIGDTRRFKDLVVRRCRVPGMGDVDVVSGMFCTGQPEPNDQAYHWKPTFFVATVPYRSTSAVAELAGSQEPAQSINQATPNVRSFLTALHVPFVHAWWRSYSMATCLAASVAVIGLIWPTLLIRITHGQWTRPPGEKGISLWGVRMRPAAKTLLAHGEDTQVREERADHAASPSLIAEPGQIASTAPRLAAPPLTPELTAEVEHKEFGAKPDDFYPTECHRQ